MEEWWRGAVIYQIYPRSFLDTNQDGIGDIAGITDRLAYIAQLGVDMVWISPFYASPMKDFGYDVSDYKSVDPIFGSLDDFAALVKKANELGLKVMIDMVFSHTSDQHPWFKESRANKDNPQADWYVWVDPQPDGSPPNNWLSIFGGGAWEWDTSRRQFYLHNFLSSQPDLNFHNPDVVDAIMDITAFWLRLGVHGFRLDTVNWYFHDRALRSNPPNEGDILLYAPESSNYVMQAHIYNKSRPEMLPFLERFRSLLNRYDAIALGELTAKRAIEMTPDYTAKDKRLHMVYTFSLLTQALSAAHFKRTIRAVEENLGDGWICWAFSNHDVVRAVSRWRQDRVSIEQQAKFLLALLLSLRGSICLYQGEELGLPEVDIAFEDIKDPYGIRLWPEFKGRDGCRTPMPWRASATNGGFSPVQPWLPVPAEHLDKAVEVQALDKSSVLQFSKMLLSWRKSQPAMIWGSLKLLEAADPLLAFERSYEGETILAVFNTGDQPCDFDCSASGKIAPIAEPIVLTEFEYSYHNGLLSLPACCAFFAKKKGVTGLCP
ncbi:MAG: alpha-glucosidase family protein [Phormidesmis sp.]